MEITRERDGMRQVMRELGIHSDDQPMEETVRGAWSGRYVFVGAAPVENPLATGGKLPLREPLRGRFSLP